MAEKKFQIRPLIIEDSFHLAALLKSIGWFKRINDESEAQTEEFVRQHLATCLSNPDHTILTASDENGQILEYTAVLWLPYLFLTSSKGFVSELFVLKTARGMGIGTFFT